MALTVGNAKVRSTSLGYEGHGILTAYVHLDYGGSGQGFGGYFLESEAMAIFVAGVLKTVGVETWEDLPGKPLRAEYELVKVHRIGHFMEDRWFDPVAAFEHLKAVAS